jgi:hypothetical protein
MPDKTKNLYFVEMRSHTQLESGVVQAYSNWEAVYVFKRLSDPYDDADFYKFSAVEVAVDKDRGEVLASTYFLS